MSLALDKDRLFAIATIGVAVLACSMYVLFPPLVSDLVAKAYRSDAAPWQRLMQERETLGLEAYQAKAIRWLRYAVAVGLTAAVTLFWVLWDHRETRFSPRALAWPTIHVRTLSVLGTGALLLLSMRGRLPYFALVLAGLLTLLAREDWQPFVRLNRALGWILQPQVSLPLVLLLAIATFLLKFPPGQFDALIFFDDYPTIYTVTLKGWEMLKQGGIFGWDPRLMGGYHTVSDVSHNEIFFFLPFLPFGPRVGFHLMILFFYLLFPFLLYGWARLEFGQERPALLTLWIGLCIGFGFFDNLLYWGMINSFIGLNLTMLNLILFALLRQGKPFADWGLILSLSLTLYAAVGFFAYSLLLLGIEFLRHFRRELIWPMAFVMGAVFGITLTFTYHFLRYPDYFIQSDEIYSPPHHSIGEVIAQSIRALARHADPQLWLIGEPVRYQGAFIVSLPILGALLWDWARGKRKQGTSGLVLMAGLIMAVSLLVSPSVDMFISRIRFVIPVILALVYGDWLAREERLHPAPLLMTLTILLALFPSRLLQPLPHVDSLRAYNAPLLGRIEALDSDLILLESMGGYDLATEGGGSTQEAELPVHLESLFPLETSKDYLANNQEGYHHSIYRRNFITSGAFRGKLLPDWPMKKVKAFLQQWGVRHLVLWSDIATDYFAGDSAFRRIWGDGFWTIYEFADAVPGDVVAGQGSGEIEVKGYFEQEVRLRDVRGGERITLRMNYFPAWRAFRGQQEIAIQDDAGQMAFVAPDSGSYAITLRYPRYTWLSILALAMLVASFVLSWWFQRTRVGYAAFEGRRT